jgi:hypothetical protein
VAENGRRKAADDTLALALASGATVAAAAQVARVSQRTVYRRLQDAAFKARVDGEREGLIVRTVGGLSALGVLATEQLRKLLSATSEAVQLGSCRAILEYQFRGAELITLTKAIADLRQRLEELEHAGAHPEARAGQAESPPGPAAAA